jgi:hypothetical protein
VVSALAMNALFQRTKKTCWIAFRSSQTGTQNQSTSTNTYSRGSASSCYETQAKKLHSVRNLDGHFLYPIAIEENATATGIHLALCAPSRGLVAAVQSAAIAKSAVDIFTPTLAPISVTPTSTQCFMIWMNIGQKF